MKFRHNRQATEAKIDMTPLIDVVFLLLIFFMVSTTFKKYSQLNVELPTSANAEEQTEMAIEIGVDATGAYFFQDEAFGQDLAALKSALLLRTNRPADLQLAIVGDKVAPHQAIVSVMDMANQLGIQKLQVIARSS